jgi:hypothetical protein
MRRLASIAIGLLLCVVLASCAARGVSEQTPYSARLHGTGNCVAGVQFYWTFLVRPALGSWRNVGPDQYVSCANDTAEVAFSHPAGGLSPQTQYEDVIVSFVYPNHGWFEFDQNGTGNGNYFRFVTTGDKGWSEYQMSNDPPEQPGDPSQPAAAQVRWCKRGLRNYFQHKEYVPEPGAIPQLVYWAYVDTDWCYNGVHISYRLSTPAAGVTFAGRTGGWYVANELWAYSDCARNALGHNWTCLTRRQVRFLSSIFFWKNEQVCIGTRIYAFRPPPANHSRNIEESACP